MRLTEFVNTQLSPGEKAGNMLNMAQLVDFVRKNCSEFLTASKGHKLFRGMRSTNAEIFMGQTRNNRTPHATNDEASALVDAKLAAAGFVAVRGNSIFCTGHSWVTQEFGVTYTIFPLNGFAFTWSHTVNDFTRLTAMTDVGMTMHHTGRFVSNSGFMPDDEWIAKLKNKVTPSVNNLLNLTAQQYVEHYKFQQGNLSAALFSGNEILIHGRYVAIKHEGHLDLIEDMYETG